MRVRCHNNLVRILAALLVAGAAPLLGAVPAGAAGAAPTPSATQRAEAPDYMSENWADAWDFSNGEDFNTLPANGGGYAGGLGLSNVTLSGGALNGTVAQGGFFDLLSAAPGALHVGRDGALRPIDTSRYTRLSMRFYASQSDVGAFYWFNCDGNPGTCAGAKIVSVSAGWNTYDLPLTNDSGQPIAWSGLQRGIRFYPNISAGTSVNVTIDWVRMYQPSGSNLTLTIPQAATEVWWDTDTNAANNGGGTGNQGAARFAGAVGGGGSVALNTDGLPPGTYYVYYVSGGTPSAYSSAITVEPRPQAVVLDPDVSGGDDWATTVRGDAWDFTQASDVAGSANADVVVGAGMANGSTAAGAPAKNDPKLYPQMNGLALDAVTYHRLTARVTYDGPFSLDDVPGGGMVARFLWRAQGQILWNETNDMIVYPLPGTNTLAVDLRTNPPAAINDEGTIGPYGWGGPASATMVELSFDPHEDPGNRSWHLDDLRLARNDRGTPTFPISFKDAAWVPGTTASLYVDADATGFNGTAIVNALPVTAGTNTFTWNGTDAGGNPLGPGTYWVYLVLTHPAGSTGRSYSTGPVDMPVQPVAPPGPPTNVMATSGEIERSTISWTAPANGLPLTGYQITVSPGGGTVDVPANSTTAEVHGLTGGTPYTFTVRAANAGGYGPYSAASGAATPMARPGARFHPVVPYRALDSRQGGGPWGGTPLGNGAVRSLPVAPSGGGGGVPASASAVVMNVTVTGGTAGSYLTAFPTNAPRPLAANLNFLPGQTVPNLVTAKVGAGGQVSFFNAVGNAHVIVDVVGYYDDGVVAGDSFFGVTPTRLYDSRAVDTGGGVFGSLPFGPGEVREIPVRGQAGIPNSATAVVVNLTATGGTSTSYLQAFPAGAAQPVTANVLLAPGQTVPNLVVVGIGANGNVSIFNQLGDVHVIADVMGYYDPAAGGRFHAVAPTRILDSRDGTGVSGNWTPGDNHSLTVAGAGGGIVPPAATGVVLNVTAVLPTVGTYVSVSPTPGTVPAPTANLLVGPGRIVPNLVMVQLGSGGQVDLYNQQGEVDLVGDVAGYFAAT